MTQRVLTPSLCACRASCATESSTLSTSRSSPSCSTARRCRRIRPSESRECTATLRLSCTPLTHWLLRRVILPSSEAIVAADAGVSKLPVNQVNLKSAWEPVDRAKPDDWREWMKRLSVQLLKSSPSLSLRACANLAEVYHPLARDLFNAAFVSCWTELYDQYQVREIACER